MGAAENFRRELWEENARRGARGGLPPAIVLAGFLAFDELVIEIATETTTTTTAVESNPLFGWRADFLKYIDSRRHFFYLGVLVVSHSAAPPDEVVFL